MPTLAEKLGFEADARVAVVHADDVGMCHAANEGAFAALENGPATCGSIMVPCPWFAEAAALGVKSLAYRADVREDADCRAMVEAAVQAFGRLDVLVNNAGTTRFIPHDQLEKVTVEDWESILAVNLRGPFQCARAAQPALEASGGGEVVNVSSVAGIAGTGSSIPYCASKAAVNNLTVTLARVLAPKVRVNAVAPGLVDTASNIAAMTPKDLKRWAKRDEIAEVVVFLGSPAAAGITGQVLAVTGWGL